MFLRPLVHRLSSQVLLSPIEKKIGGIVWNFSARFCSTSHLLHRPHKNTKFIHSSSQPKPPTSHTFAGSPLDRIGGDGHVRNQEWVDSALVQETTRIVMFEHGTKVLVGPNEMNSSQKQVLWLHPKEYEAQFQTKLSNPVFLGFWHDSARFAVNVPAHVPRNSLYPHREFVSIRSVLPAIASPHEAAIVGHGSTLLQWHLRCGFCSNCGAQTQSQSDGSKRICVNESCEAQFFPRIDPVVIFATESKDGRHLLLGRRATMPSLYYSLLAGFIEAGESIEEAVAREALEETNVKVHRVRYHSSQPWPFPGQLMIGCFCVATDANPTIKIDEAELQDARWFSRRELVNAVTHATSDVKLPPRFTIARHLIDTWIAAGH